MENNEYKRVMLNVYNDLKSCINYLNENKIEYATNIEVTDDISKIKINPKEYYSFKFEKEYLMLLLRKLITVKGNIEIYLLEASEDFGSSYGSYDKIEYQNSDLKIYYIIVKNGSLVKYKNKYRNLIELVIDVIK